MGLTFASYVFQPLFAAGCSVPTIGLQLFAAVTICLLTYINAYDVRVTTKMQNVFMFTKIGALVLVIIVGVVWMSLGGTENFENAFENTETDPGKLAVAFYSGIFSYAGWYVGQENLRYHHFTESFILHFQELLELHDGGAS